MICRNVLELTRSAESKTERLSKSFSVLPHIAAQELSVYSILFRQLLVNCWMTISNHLFDLCLRYVYPSTHDHGSCIKTC